MCHDFMCMSFSSTYIPGISAAYRRYGTVPCRHKVPLCCYDVRSTSTIDTPAITEAYFSPLPQSSAVWQFLTVPYVWSTRLKVGARAQWQE